MRLVIAEKDILEGGISVLKKRSFDSSNFAKTLSYGFQAPHFEFLLKGGTSNIL
jgi:hypothetical protein